MAVNSFLQDTPFNPYKARELPVFLPREYYIPHPDRSNYQFKVTGSFHISKGLNVYTTFYTYERM